MGDAVRNCNRNAVLEASSTVSTVSKKRRIVGLSSSNAKLESTRSCVDSPENAVSPVNFEDFARVNAGVLCSSVCTDQLPASCCSSNESCEVVRDSLKLMDLEAKSFETVDSTYINNKFRETTPSSELCGDSDEMDSLAMKPSSANHRRSPPVAKTPPEEEIEEFFATAEKYEHKRFAEKYNYDIVKDMPLEGRYQWIRLKP